MAKTLNVSEIVREYLLFKSVFGNEKVQNYKKQLKLNGNEAKHDLVSLYEKFIENVGKIEVPSLANSKVLVSLDEYLNDLQKTYTTKGGSKLKPERYLEFGNQVDTMIGSVPSAQATLLNALEKANYAEIARKFKLGVGKAGGKQTLSVANEIVALAGMSGKNTQISSLEKQIANLKIELDKAKKDGKSTTFLVSQIDALNLEMKKELLNQSNLIRAIAASDGKRMKNIETTLTGVSDTVKENNSMLKKLLKVKPVRWFWIALLALAGINVALNVADLVIDKEPAPIVENGGYKELLDQINMAIADGKMSAEEITDLKNFIQVEITDVNEQKQYNNMVDSLAESTKLQGIKTNIVELAKVFGIAEEEGITEAELENKIVNDEAFRAEVIANVANYAKYADYDEIQNIVTSVGDKLGIAQKAENESNNDFKNRVLEAIGGIQTENAALSAEVDRLEDVKNGMFLRIADLSANVQENTKEIAGLKSTIENLNTTIESLNAQIETLTSASSNGEAIKLLQAQLAEAQAGKASAEKALAEKTAEFDNKVAEFETIVEELKTTIAEKDEKIEDLEAKVAELEKKLEEAPTQEEIDALNVQIDELNKEIIELENENTKLETTLSTVEEQLETAKDKISSLENENSSLKNENASLKGELESAKANANSLAEQVQNLTEENAQLKEDLKEVSEKYEQLKVDYDKVAKLYNDKLDEYNALEEQLKNTVSAEEAQALRTKIAELSAELEEAKKALDEMEGTAEYLVYNLNNFASKFGISGLSPEEVLDAILQRFGVTPIYPETGNNSDEKQPQ